MIGLRIIKYCLFVLICSLTTSVSAQIVIQFTWDSGPVTAADVGPDATSISASAVSDVGGVGGTNGLNAGLPKANIVMVIPGSPTFDIDGVDVSFDYQREEAIGDFFTRGSSLRIRGCNNLSVNYRVEDGSGGFTSVSSGNVFSIPNDDTYRNYRFTYTPCDGVGMLMVNGAVVWTNDGPDERNMYWTGAGDVVIGAGIDGTGFNNTFLDNLIIGDIDCSLLPVELTKFEVTTNELNCLPEITWETQSERNNSFYTIQRSQDGINWESISEITGAGTVATTQTYSFIDETPIQGLAYYRLVQTDFNGTQEIFDPISFTHSQCNSNPLFFYPNPTSDLIYLSNVAENSTIDIYNMLGINLTTKLPNIGIDNVIDLSNLPSGNYMLVINGATYKIVKI